MPEKTNRTYIVTTKLNSNMRGLFLINEVGL